MAPPPVIPTSGKKKTSKKRVDPTGSKNTAEKTQKKRKLAKAAAATATAAALAASKAPAKPLTSPSVLDEDMRDVEAKHPSSTPGNYSSSSGDDDHHPNRDRSPSREETSPTGTPTELSVALLMAAPRDAAPHIFPGLGSMAG